MAEKRRLKKGLMQQLLTGKRRFPDFGPVSDGAGYPSDWEHPRAGEVFARVSVKGNGEAPVLSVTQDEGVVLRDSLERKIDASSDNFGNYKLVEPGDFVISLRSFQGGLEYSSIRGIVSPAYHVIRARRRIMEDFYRHYFKSYEFIGRLAISIIGIRDGKQVNFDDFAFIKVPFPSLEEQQRIADTLNTCDRELELLRQQRDAIAMQKKGLMQHLLTGKVRVPVDGDRVEVPS
jgi:type I restriction enzyme S subunit